MTDCIKILLFTCVYQVIFFSFLLHCAELIGLLETNVFMGFSSLRYMHTQRMKGSHLFTDKHESTLECLQSANTFHLVMSTVLSLISFHFGNKNEESEEPAQFYTFNITESSRFLGSLTGGDREGELHELDETSSKLPSSPACIPIVDFLNHLLRNSDPFGLSTDLELCFTGHGSGQRLSGNCPLEGNIDCLVRK